MSNARETAQTIYELLPHQEDEVKRLVVGNSVHIIKAEQRDVSITVVLH